VLAQNARRAGKGKKRPDEKQLKSEDKWGPRTKKAEMQADPDEPNCHGQQTDDRSPRDIPGARFLPFG
jgi:hypothetical protein